jgi:hypothetical protein
LELNWLQDRLRMKQAFLPQYYDGYIDGLRNKTPQLVPLLRYMESKVFAVTAWGRLPLELLEMLLLIFMGALGAVIAVTRCFVDAATPNPAARDLCYRPAAGAVIALRIYVLYRAAQLFFGGGGQAWDWRRAFVRKTPSPRSSGSRRASCRAGRHRRRRIGPPAASSARLPLSAASC